MRFCWCCCKCCCHFRVTPNFWVELRLSWGCDNTSMALNRNLSFSWNFSWGGSWILFYQPVDNFKGIENFSNNLAPLCRILPSSASTSFGISYSLAIAAASPWEKKVMFLAAMSSSRSDVVTQCVCSSVRPLFFF